MRHQVGVGDQHARRVRVRAEDADRLARLHEQRLVVVEPRSERDDGVEGVPDARRLAGAAVDDESSGRSATSGSRLFISMRRAASWRPSQTRQRRAAGGADGANERGHLQRRRSEGEVKIRN